MTLSRSALLLGGALFLGGCAGARDATHDSARARESKGAPRIAVSLVDSVPYANELESGALRRVLVTSAAGVDTIREVLTDQLPVVLGDSLVVGFRYAEDRVLGVFHYAPASRRLATVALPFDFFAWGTPRLAPDGRHLAYFGHDSTGLGYVVVLAWPSGEVRHRGEPVRVLATDGGVDEIKWGSPRMFGAALLLAEPQGALQRTHGEIGPDDGVTVQVDTFVAVAKPDGAR